METTAQNLGPEPFVESAHTRDSRGAEGLLKTAMAKREAPSAISMGPVLLKAGLIVLW